MTHAPVLFDEARRTELLTAAKRASEAALAFNAAYEDGVTGAALNALAAAAEKADVAYWAEVRDPDVILAICAALEARDASAREVWCGECQNWTPAVEDSTGEICCTEGGHIVVTYRATVQP